MSLATRAVAASTKAHSRRCASATAARGSAGCGSAAWSGAPASSMAASLPVRSGDPVLSGNSALRRAAGGVHDRADLDAPVRRRAELADGQRVVQVPGFDQVEPAESFLGLGERPVGDHVTADRGGGGGGLQRVAAEDLAALRDDLLG